MRRAGAFPQTPPEISKEVRIKTLTLVRFLPVILLVKTPLSEIDKVTRGYS